MAIPIGATAGQFSSIARWTFACLVVLAVFAWASPSTAGWGAVLIGLLVTLLIWLMCQTTEGRRTVPAHPVQWVLLVPAGILAYHLGRQSLPTPPDPLSHMDGAVNVSMLLQVAMLSLGIMLSQSLLPKAAQHVVALGICGAAMMSAPLAARLYGDESVQAMRHTLALLAFAGVGVWLSSLWGVGWRTEVWTPERRGKKPRASSGASVKVARVAIVAVAAAVSCWLTWVSPPAAMLAAAALGGVVLLGGVVFPGNRAVLLVAGGVVTGGALLASGIVPRLAEISLNAGEMGLVGLGELAFGRVSASDNGLTVLAWTIGWGGVWWMAGGMVVCIAYLMSRARTRRAWDRRRVIVWTWATVLSSCAMLSVGGLFSPAMVLSASLTWGLMPRMVGRGGEERSGGVFLLVLAAMAVVLGIARNGGLIHWSVSALFAAPRIDKYLHVGTGVFLTMTMAWLMSARHKWLGVVGICLAAGAGVLGEVVQLAFQRQMDLRDVGAHLVGCAAGAIPFLLCMGARWCESPDARAPDTRGADAYQRA